MILLTSTLDEEQIIHLIWKSIGTRSRRDPFDDDAVWVRNKPKRFIVCKTDMLVAETDAPKQMSPAQIARKAVVSCISDFAAKGVKPLYCLVSLGIPSHMATSEYVSGVTHGFSLAQKEYGIKIIGGDTGATTSNSIIDCTINGQSEQLVRRRGAKIGDLIGVSGSFGHQAAGLLTMVNNATIRNSSFRRISTESVLKPKARLRLGLKAAPFLTSSIDSSDGLALSLYHLAESNNVNMMLDSIPITNGVEEFAVDNGMTAFDLALFGGEEFEIVCTYDPRFSVQLSRLGIKSIGQVDKKSHGKHPCVYFGDKRIERKGWIHFKSETNLT